MISRAEIAGEHILCKEKRLFTVGSKTTVGGKWDRSRPNRRNQTGWTDNQEDVEQAIDQGVGCADDRPTIKVIAYEGMRRAIGENQCVVRRGIH